MKNDTLKIAVWELMRNLRNKQYLISLIITPIIMVVFAGLPKLLEKLDKPSTTTLYVIDELGILPVLKQAMPEPEFRFVSPKTPEDVEAEVYKEKAAGYLIVKQDFFSSGKLEYHYNKRSITASSTLKAVFSQLLKQQRMSTMNLAAEQMQYLTAEASIQEEALENALAPKKNVVIVSAVFALLIFFLIFSSGSMLMQSALQERRDRMAEIVLSSIKPKDLMQGKILGHLCLGIIQIFFWIALSLPGVVYLLDFPILATLADTNMLLMLFFGIGGYLLFSTIYVSIGSTMDDLQSAGNTQSMIMMIPMLSFLFVGPIVSNPEGPIARFASIFPLTSPTCMIVRNAFIKVPVPEALLSAVVLMLSILLFIRLAAKIFRVGMLMYGKTANFSEMMKWLKYKE